MSSYIKPIAIMGLLVILIASCGGGTEKAAKPADSPETILKTIKLADIGIASEVSTYEGESLYEYINGGAEVWHTYDFTRVSTADFKAGDIEMVADIYEFDNSTGAYGMYSMLRPDNIEVIDIGVQGYSSESNFDFVKGKYIVRILNYDNTPEATEAMAELAGGFESVITGTTSLPVLFTKFPIEKRKPNSEKISAESYLGQAGLNDVFTVDYDFDNENVQLFLADDKAGRAFDSWMSSAEIDANGMKEVKDLPYANGKVMITRDSYYGQVLAGIKNGKIAGVVNYSEQVKPLIYDWLIQ